MKIDNELISQLEKLAELELPAEEREKLRLDLEKMTDLMDKLSGLEVREDAETGMDNHPVPGWRDDDPAPALPAGEALREAPLQDGSFFLVPKVISSKSTEKP